MKKLEELKLIPIGRWEIQVDKLVYVVKNDIHLNIPNSLYAIVVNEPQNEYIAYIKKNTQALDISGNGPLFCDIFKKQPVNIGDFAIIKIIGRNQIQLI